MQLGLVMVLSLVVATEGDAGVGVRLGVQLGGAFASNVHQNASGLADGAGVGRLELDVDWPASETTLVKLAYRGDAELYGSLESERQLGQLAELSLGVRLAEVSYLSLIVGGEQAHYLEGETYSFTGGFAGAALRLELGEATTLRASYRLRHDRFLRYDLDNTAHATRLVYELALTDDLEAELPAELVLTTYGERFVLDASGLPTGAEQSARLWRLEPTLRFLPSFSLRVTASMQAELNDSDATFLYTGPYGVVSPTIPRELMAGFDVYRAMAPRLRVRWQPSDAFFAGAEAVVGWRAYDSRPAFDASGLPTAERQRDTFVETRLELEWRPSPMLGVIGAYTHVRQWSNDALWDFAADVVDLRLALFAGN